MSGPGFRYWPSIHVTATVPQVKVACHIMHMVVKARGRLLEWTMLHDSTSRRLTALVLSTVTVLAVMAGAMAGTAVAQEAGNEASPTEIDSCTTIDEPGQYVLTTDIENSTAAECIDIETSDVHFDGNGHTVAGNLSRATIENASGGAAPRTRVGVGVNVRTSERVENVTVTNVTTTNWFHGVLSENVTDGRTSHVTANTNGGGIIYDNSSDVVVTRSNASNNVILGIIIDSRAGVPNADNRVVNNVAESNGFFGVAMFLSNNSHIADNEIHQNTFGIFAYGTSDSTFADNDAQNNSAVGFALEGDLRPVVEDEVEAAEPRAPQVNVSENNVVVDNDFSESGAIAMGFLGPSETYVNDNNVSNVPGTSPFPLGFPNSGIYLDQSSDNVIRNTDASNINGSGIVLQNASDGNVLFETTATSNVEDGVRVNGSSNVVVSGREATETGDVGVEIANATDVVRMQSTIADNGDEAIEQRDSEGVVVLNSTEQSDG